jgi:hypothetical protein
MNQIATVSADLAKTVIVACAADAGRRLLFFKQLSFRGFSQWAAALPLRTLGMEACGPGHQLGASAGCARPHRAADGC